MQVIHPRCAGLDVHQKTVVVTSMITEQDGTVQRERQTFSTMTADLLVLDDWLRQRQIEIIALESTGVDWLWKHISTHKELERMFVELILLQENKLNKEFFNRLAGYMVQQTILGKCLIPSYADFER